jgi:glycosyl transferase family 2
MREMSPVMSVILPTPDEFETIRRTVDALRDQTIADSLELVIVAPTEISVDSSALAGFAGVQVVAAGPITSSNAARVAGIRVARASVIALAEDHCFPQPEWAASLVAGHRKGFAVVGPVLDNANPRTAVSWANFLAEYGRWAGATAGEIEQLPGHNSAYGRDLLLQFGDDLGQLMEAESVIQEVLRRQGGRLLLEPAARALHYNFSLWSSSVRLRFQGGRLFAGHRVRLWNGLRRLLYLAGAPLIPLVRFRRLLPLARKSDCRVPLMQLAPVLLALLVIDAAGELVGYLTGPGQAATVLASIEFHRDQHMTRADRSAYRAKELRSAVVPSPSPSPV